MGIALVILSGLIHSIWNLFAKRSRNKVVFLWYCQLAAIILYVPLTLQELAGADPLHLQALPAVFGSMLLHGLYTLQLARTYAIADLSQAYPIMRGTSPLLVPLLGVTLLGEELGAAQWLGIAAIAAGIVWIGGGLRVGSALRSGPERRTLLLAFSVGLLITGYTLVDKIALQSVPPFTLNAAGNFGNLIALSWSATRSRELIGEWRLNAKTIVLGGILAPGGYVLFLLALQTHPAAILAPMREIGTVFGTVLGIVVLHESQGVRRLAASVLITAGVMLLALQQV